MSRDSAKVATGTTRPLGSRPSARAGGVISCPGTFAKLSFPCPLYVAESSLHYTYPREAAFLTELSSDPPLIIYSRKDPSDCSPGCSPCSNSWSYTQQAAVDLTATCLGLPSIPCIQGPQAICGCRPGEESSHAWLGENSRPHSSHPTLAPFPHSLEWSTPKRNRQIDWYGGRQAGNEQKDK